MGGSLVLPGAQTSAPAGQLVLPPDPQVAIRAKYGLPPNADLSKTYFENSAASPSARIDPSAFSQAYQEFHGQSKPEAPTGFLANLKQEAKNVWHGLTGPAEGVPGAPDLPVSEWLQRGRELEDAGNAAAQGRPVAAAGHAIGAIPVVGPTIEARGRQLARGDIGGAAGAGLVDAAATAAPLVIGRFLGGDEAPAEEEPRTPLRQRAGEALARPTIARPLRKLRTEERYGANPERAIVSAKVTNSGQAAQRMDVLGKVMDEKLSNSRGLVINTDRIIDEVTADAARQAQKTGRPGAARQIEQIGETLKDAWGSPEKSPRAAAEMYRGIRKGVKYGPDPDMNMLSDYRKQISGAISNAIKREMPDVADLMQDYQDTAAAHDDMKTGESQRSMKGPLARLREGSEVYATRKAAQIIAGKPRAGTRPIAEPLSAGPEGPKTLYPAGLGPNATRELPDVGGTTGPTHVTAENPTPPAPAPPAKPLPEGQKPAPGLPAAFRLRGTELQSEAGPEGKPIRVQAGTPPPEGVEHFHSESGPGEKPIELGPGQDAAKAQAKAKEQAKAATMTPEQLANEQRARLAELDRRDRDLTLQLTKARKYESSKRIIGELRKLSEQRQALREALGIQRPEAKPLQITPDSRVGQVVPDRPAPARAHTSAEESQPKESQTPTFDSLPKDVQDKLREWDGEINHLPQLLREDEESDLSHWGQKGSRRIEKLARRYAHQAGLPVKKASTEPMDVMEFLKAMKKPTEREPGED